MMRSSRGRTILALLALIMVWPSAASAEDQPATDFGMGLASFVVTVPYLAVKASMAGLGGVVGGFTYVMSGFNKNAADQVWLPGDYVVTPDHLMRNRSLRFTGDPPQSKLSKK